MPLLKMGLFTLFTRRLKRQITNNVMKSVESRAKDTFSRGSNSEKLSKKEMAKADAQAAKRKRENAKYNGLSSVDEDGIAAPIIEEKNTKDLKMPSFEFTDEEKAAMEKLVEFNRNNRYGVADDPKYMGMSDSVKKLYQYLEKAQKANMFKKLMFNKKEEKIIVQFEKLNLDIFNDDFPEWYEIHLTPKAILNTDGDDYIKLSKGNPSILMTELLKDYQYERASLLYSLVNYYHKEKNTY